MHTFTFQVDALAPHVREAKQAVYLGKSPRDYTNKEKLLQVTASTACSSSRTANAVQQG